MKGSEVREKYLKFFEERGHKRIDPAPLVLKDDPTTLFTSAGMQPLVPYLKGKIHSGGKRLVDSQPCFRSQDIEEVGDNRHDTLFEMLGNWSLGDYFKKDQIPWVWKFITEVLGLPKEKISVTVFEGYGTVPKDEETFDLWKSLGVKEDHIHFYGVKKNWWSISGTPEQMVEGEIGGPSSEIFYEFTEVKHDSRYGEKCHPNCDCGRFVEIGNSVFIQYKKLKDGKLEELPQKNVDFGGGLERILMAVNNEPDMFKNDLHYPLIKKIEELSGKNYSEEKNKTAMRVIADHLKASTFLIASGVVPMGKLHGYVLRRLLRRAAVKANNLGLDPVETFKPIVEIIVEDLYADIHFFGKKSGMGTSSYIYDQIIDSELRKFVRTLDKGLKRIEKVNKEELDEKFAFDLMQSEGFPFEITQELAQQKGVGLNIDKFNEEMKKHQELSRKGGAEKFKLK